MPVRVTQLQVGRRYRSNSGAFIRVIDSIVGNVVLWHDDLTRDGRCTRQTFIRAVQELLPEPPAPA